MDRKPGCRELKFTAVQMMTMVFYVEIKKLDVPGYIETFSGRGSQIILRNLGMPKDGRGRYIAPSVGWLSDFRNKEWRKFRKALEEETREAVLAMSEKTVYTVDSTPVEASRYSAWADFNPHYRIRMAKAHIVMVDGIPAYHRVTNGNKGDNPEFLKILDEMGTGSVPSAAIHADGGYDSAETYTKVFLSTGKVMRGNPGCNAVFHKEYGWDNMLRRYARLHREDGFVPTPQVSRGFVLRFLAGHGQDEAVGWFLRNLDICRGSKARADGARRRHVCETVHHGMKRWVDLTVRGLCRRYVGTRVSLRIFVCTILCVLFKPYSG